MADWFEWKCSNCGYEIRTSGPHEFYRDAAGNWKQYGHPVPCSEEAREMGVKGFTITGYCRKCHNTREAIVLEFEKPTKNGRH